MEKVRAPWLAGTRPISDDDQLSGRCVSRLQCERWVDGNDLRELVIVVRLRRLDVS